MTRRVMPTPSVVARFAGPDDGGDRRDRLAADERCRWVAGRFGTDHRRGAAGRLAGEVTLEPGGQGAVLTYTGDLTVRVPILGPGLAKQAAPLLLEALEIQQKVGREYLANR